jgi:methylthioribose-1-phosphate isomerase
MRAHIRWTGRGSLELLDQRLLPSEVVFKECRSASEVASAIRDMVVRGAPAIGISAAYGMALAARSASVSCANRRDFKRQVTAEAEVLASARPTAVNLRWAVDRLLRLAADLVKSGAEPDDVAASMEEEAVQIHRDDVSACKAIGKVGAAFVPKKAHILTHCNAGALATGGFGTALGVVRAARESGKSPRVYADETRPYLQGARLTAWELKEDDIPVTVICESAAASLLASGKVDLVVVGADRIAANGDTANKIGTYPLAVLAARHGVPFYVAAPLSTFDPDLRDGAGIPIEVRSSQEILKWGGQFLAPNGVEAHNPAFDVTPHELITALFTEAGAVKPVNSDTVGELLARLRP